MSTIKDELDEMFAELDKEILPPLLDTDITHAVIADRYKSLNMSIATARTYALSMCDKGLWRMIPKRARTGQTVNTYEVTHD